MSCSKDNNNIDVRLAFNKSFNNLYNYAKLRNNHNSNLYEPSSDIYGDRILINIDGFTSNISNNIDLENYIGNDDIIENKDNIFIIDDTTKSIYENCVITSGIPWYSTNNKFNKCEVPNNIHLDDNNVLKMSDDKKTINYNFKSDKKNAGFCSHYVNTTKAYCENTWYDWLVIPNYYLGNTYYKDIGKYTEKDVYKCYKPCEGDYIPFRNNKNEMKCIPKKLYSGGLLMNKYKYSALGLINLIGNITTINNDYNTKNNNLTYINYYLIFYYKHNINIDNDIYQPNQIFTEIISNTNKNEVEFNKFKPVINEVELEFIKCIKNEIIDYNNFDNSLNQNYDNLNIFSYKSNDFQEKRNDLFTLNGLENNNILIDPILIHTWILANLYRPYEKTDLTNIADKSSISNTELYDLLLTNNFDNDKTKNINIAIRLKNIFFRAVNVCYNNKTTFSANIINRTKRALQNKDLVNLILDKNFYINTNYDENSNCYNSYKSNNFSTKEKLENFLNNLTLVDDFKEIQYYNDVELSELVYSITPKNDLLKNIIGDFGMKNNTDNEINGENNRFKYLFSIEYLEVSNTCKLNEVYNPITGLCNPRPPVIEDIKEEENIDSINDDFKLPQMKFFLSLFIQAVFVIIVGYVIYLFYNIFGETILASINWIYETIENLLNGININKLNREIEASLDDPGTNKITKLKKILDIELKQHQEDYDNIKRKIDIIDDYMTDNNIEKEDL